MLCLRDGSADPAIKTDRPLVHSAGDAQVVPLTLAAELTALRNVSPDR